MKCRPGTVISVWSGQVPQKSRWAPVRMTPGSASMGVAASQSA
jgi:hypothetical protein